jgi:hypothetical protein
VWREWGRDVLGQRLYQIGDAVYITILGGSLTLERNLGQDRGLFLVRTAGIENFRLVGLRLNIENPIQATHGCSLADVNRVVCCCFLVLRKIVSRLAK